MAPRRRQETGLFSECPVLVLSVLTLANIELWAESEPEPRYRNLIRAVSTSEFLLFAAQILTRTLTGRKYPAPARDWSVRVTGGD